MVNLVFAPKGKTDLPARQVKETASTAKHQSGNWVQLCWTGELLYDFEKTDFSCRQSSDLLRSDSLTDTVGGARSGRC